MPPAKGNIERFQRLQLSKQPVESFVCNFMATIQLQRLKLRQPFKVNESTISNLVAAIQVEMRQLCQTLESGETLIVERSASARHIEIREVGQKLKPFPFERVVVANVERLQIR